MFLFLIIYAILSLISIAFIFYLMMSTPNGWEDKEGFHISKRK